MSHHDEEDEDFKAHEARDWELIQGDDLDLRIEGLLCIANRRGEDPEAQVESLAFAESAETILRDLDDPARLYSALRTKADALYCLKRFDDAKDACLESAGHAASQLMDGKAGQMFFNAGGCAYNLKQHEQAVELCLKAAAFLESANSPLDAAVALAWAGRNYFSLEAFVSAIEVYKRAIDVFEEEGALLKVADCSRLMAKAYLGAGELELAERALDRADACLEFLPCEETTEKVRFARARLLAARGDHSLAIALFTQMFDVAKELGNVDFTTKIAFVRAKSEMALGFFDKAAKTFRQLALTLTGTKSPITSVDALLQLLKVYQLAGSAVDQELVLNELFEMAEVTENPELSSKLTMQLGILLTGASDGQRALRILEGLPLSSFAIGSEAWIEHSLGLMQNYEQVGRRTECLFLANELLALENIGQFHDALQLIKETKVKALAAIENHDEEFVLFG
jgi:tetratricopeptide (TPR) repeat protein